MLTCRVRNLLSFVVTASLCASAAQNLAQAPKPKVDQNALYQAHNMLRAGYDHIRASYYDPTYRGIDLDARFHQYDAMLDRAQSLGQMFGIISNFVSGFKDSHLYFRPPSRPVVVEPGYEMEMIGDKCMVTRVRPGTDAATKLHPGDQVSQLNGFNITAKDLFDMDRYFHVLSPSPQDRLQLIGKDAAPRDITVNSVVVPKKGHLDLTQNDNDYRDILVEGEEDDDRNRERYYESGDVMIWKMRRFDFDQNTVAKLISKAQKHSLLIIDVRDNGGGSVESLTDLVGRLFDHDVKIADRVGRKEMKPQLAKHWGGKPYGGKVIVLIDRNSASASELLARTVQLEHRGTVIGDRSAGAVMEAQQFSDSLGGDSVIIYGYSITDADLKMADGKSLENAGVTPDEVVLPTTEDLAQDRDPVLAKAAAEGGLQFTPEAAGKLFPYEWAPLK